MNRLFDNSWLNVKTVLEMLSGKKTSKYWSDNCKIGPTVFFKIQYLIINLRLYKDRFL